jgi:hypothetical protein
MNDNKTQPGWSIFAAAVIAVCVALILTGCGFGFDAATTGYEDPAAQRLRAEANATAAIMAAAGQGTATAKAADVQAEATRTALGMERDRQDHRQALQMQPMILVLAGAGIAVLVIVIGAVLIYRQQGIRRQELARPVPQVAQLPPTVNIVNVLPGTGATSRREMWLEAQRKVNEVIVYNERGSRQ